MRLILWIIVVMSLFFIDPSAVFLHPTKVWSANSFNVYSWHLKVFVHRYGSHGVLVNRWRSYDMSENSILLVHNVFTKLYQLFWVIIVVGCNKFLPADVYVGSFVVDDVDFIVYLLIRDPRVVRVFDL